MYKSELFQNPHTPSYSITTIPSQLMPQSSTVASKDDQIKETTLEEFTTGEEKNWIDKYNGKSIYGNFWKCS